MAGRIEDYAIVGDMQSVALLSTDGSVDWRCLPRFDSEACFAALLGTDDHGQWRIAPVEGTAAATRRYAGDTLILETDWETRTARSASPTSCRRATTTNRPCWSVS